MAQNNSPTDPASLANASVVLNGLESIAFSSTAGSETQELVERQRKALKERFLHLVGAEVEEVERD